MGIKKELRKLTILHSNDMHGDFLAKQVDDRLLGGVSMLSGYLNRVRSEEKNVIYTIAGDLFRGSLIDSEYKGLSTIEITNLLAPDVVTLGNHEMDYGIGHLLFLEKCARFPIISANMYLTNSAVRLFSSHKIIEMDGMKILFIGVLTRATLAQTRQDGLIGGLIDIREPAAEVEKVCRRFRTEDIDFTVLLTHIGFEEDKKLAAQLDPDWGVDLIIGGHSHTLLTEPVVVNGIPIVQAATGTGQVGRFDLVVDREKNCVDSFRWQLVEINEDSCPRDRALEEVILRYKDKTDAKYGRVVTRFEDVYTHPARNRETQLGRVFSDVFREGLGVDIMFLGSGAIRVREMGPIVEYQHLLTAFGFDEALYRVTLNGEQLRRALKWILREEAYTGHTEFYQFSEGVKIVYSREKREFLCLEFRGEPVRDEQLFDIGLHEYHLNNMEDFLKVSKEEAEKNRLVRKLAPSSCDLLDEQMSCREIIRDLGEERLVILA